MKKLILIFSVFFLFFISGCSENSDKIKNISFLTWGSQSEITTVKKLIDVFEQNNKDIKINLIHVPDNYFRKLHLLVASNLAPDVIFINNLNSKIYINAKKIIPLNEYIQKSNRLNINNFFTVAIDAFSQEKNIYAIPRDVSNLVIYYNKDIMKKYAGVLPVDSWSFQEFLQIAQKTTIDLNNDDKTDIYGFGFEKNSLFWLPFLWQYSGGILSTDLSKVIIDAPASMDALQFYADLRNKYNVAPSTDEQASLTTSQMFLQGRIAMHLCGKWCALTYKKNANFEWDVLPFPANTAENRKIPMDASGWAISSSSKNKNEAWRFIEFMSSEYAISKITNDGLILPALKTVAFSDIFLKHSPNNSKAFLQDIDYAIPTPVCVKYSEILDILDGELEKLFNGKSSVDDIINKELVNKLEKLLD